MTPALLWFRRDLRLSDLPPLQQAAADGAEVLACFVLDPRLEAGAGPRRLQFLGDSLRALDDALGGRLLITRGHPEERIPVVSFMVTDVPAERVVQRLADNAGLATADANSRVLELLGVTESGGAVTIGLAHYSTMAEVDHLIRTLASLG